ncbi:MAG: YtxH domain-containing protein [Anaerolineae bacterium]|nr:YtxH domain-containing protein [Anaerolineae bacterium]
MSDRDEFGAFLMGFIVGGVAGAISALLLAPQSGEETRAIIKEKSIELRDRANETIDDAYVQAEKAAVEARTRFDELAKVTRERTDDLARHGQVVLEEQKAKISEVLPKKKVEVQKPEGETPAA